MPSVRPWPHKLIQIVLLVERNGLQVLTYPHFSWSRFLVACLLWCNMKIYQKSPKLLILLKSQGCSESGQRKASPVESRR
jgi:hypothetical protein